MDYVWETPELTECGNGSRRLRQSLGSNCGHGWIEVCPLSDGNTKNWALSGGTIWAIPEFGCFGTDDKGEPTPQIDWQRVQLGVALETNAIGDRGGAGLERCRHD